MNVRLELTAPRAVDGSGVASGRRPEHPGVRFERIALDVTGGAR